MNLFLQKILFSCIFTFSILAIHAQVNLSLSVSPGQINKDEFATLKIIVENASNLEHVTPPSLQNFMVLSGPNEETSMTSVNGQFKRYTSIEFILKPTATGKITIEPALVRLGGKTYKTNTTTLFVKNAVSGKGTGQSLRRSSSAFDPFEPARPSSEFNDYILRQGENVSEKVNKNMQLRLETDRTSCYIGEPIVATYKLYTRLKSESKLTGNPAFNGFSVIDMTSPDISEYSRQQLSGREYNVYTIRKAQLYPLQSGTIMLEGAELENNIQFIREGFANSHQQDVFDLFDNLSGATVPPDGIINQTVSLRSKPVSITVKPLPEINKPASFNGAVGEFNIETALQKTSFAANESGKLILKISGKGNLQILTAPVIHWPSGIDGFEPNVSESISKHTIPISGTKIFEYSFSANKPGNYILPAIEFSYFDPGSATYKNITSKALAFTVTEGMGPVTTRDSIITRQDTASGINRIFNNRWWIILFLAIAAIIGVIIWFKREKATPMEATVPLPKDPEELKLENILETSAINQRNPLVKTEECLYQDDCDGFYKLLNSELKGFLSRKFSLGPAELNTNNIVAAMDSKSINNDITLQLEALLQEIEWQLYTPFERNEKMRELYQRSHDIIQLINTQEFKHL